MPSLGVSSVLCGGVFKIRGECHNVEGCLGFRWSECKLLQLCIVRSTGAFNYESEWWCFIMQQSLKFEGACIILRGEV